MQKKTTISVIIILLFFSGKAQTHDLDKQYTPGSNSIFNSDPNSKNNNRSGITQVKNMIKFSPTMLFREKAVLFYEREIIKGITVIGGIGKAFGDDVFQKSYLELFSSTQPGSNSLSPDEILSNSKYYGSSPYLFVGMRAYFSEHTFDESYIELSYSHEKMSYSINDDYIRDINYVSAANDNYVTFKMQAFSFGYGYSTLAGPKSNLSHTLHLNFGVKFLYFDEISAYTFSSVTNGQVPGYQKTGSTLQTKIVPSVSLGYTFGFGF